MSKVNKYDIEYEIARVYPFTRCDEYSHAWECHQATVYSYYSENLKYYAEGKLTLERINEWLKLPEENRSKCETEAIDFESPENFMKLFKLITTIENFDIRTGNFFIPYIPSYRQITTLKTDNDEYSSENPDPIKAFLTCVLKCVSNDEDTAEYIRETEWE